MPRIFYKIPRKYALLLLDVFVRLETIIFFSTVIDSSIHIKWAEVNCWWKREKTGGGKSLNRFDTLWISCASVKKKVKMSFRSLGFVSKIIKLWKRLGPLIITHFHWWLSLRHHEINSRLFLKRKRQWINDGSVLNITKLFDECRWEEIDGAM